MRQAGKKAATCSSSSAAQAKREETRRQVAGRHRHGGMDYTAYKDMKTTTDTECSAVARHIQGKGIPHAGKKNSGEMNE